jgi:hypothetical protein
MSKIAKFGKKTQGILGIKKISPPTQWAMALLFEFTPKI